MIAVLSPGRTRRPRTRHLSHCSYETDFKTKHDANALFGTFTHRKNCYDINACVTSATYYSQLSKRSHLQLVSWVTKTFTNMSRLVSNTSHPVNNHHNSNPDTIWTNLLHGGQNKYRSGLVKLIRALVNAPMMTSFVSKTKDRTVKIFGFPNCTSWIKPSETALFSGGENLDIKCHDCKVLRLPFI